PVESFATRRRSARVHHQYPPTARRTDHVLYRVRVSVTTLPTPQGSLHSPWGVKLKQVLGAALPTRHNTSHEQRSGPEGSLGPSRLASFSDFLSSTILRDHERTAPSHTPLAAAGPHHGPGTVTAPRLVRRQGRPTRQGSGQREAKYGRPTPGRLGQ